MFTLAHLSDPHLGPLPKPTFGQLASKRITGYINFQKNRSHVLTDNTLERLIGDLKSQSPDHIALTGDLVNIALPKEIMNARGFLETLGKAKDVSLVGGNHDAYVPGAFEQAKQEWGDYFRSDDDGTMTPISFPSFRRRDCIAIIGLSSANPTSPFMATGTLGHKQVAKAEKLLRTAKRAGLFRVVLVHHPPYVDAAPWHKRLTDGPRLLTMLQQTGAELVLHGHTHKRSTFKVDGPEQPIPVVGVPSASSRLIGHHEPARYNLFHIEGEDNAWMCTHVERGLTLGNDITELERQIL